MLVKFIDSDDPVVLAVRRHAKLSSDECTDAESIATEFGAGANRLLTRLDQLEEMDWVSRDGNDWTVPATPLTRWIPRFHNTLTCGEAYEVLAINGEWYRILNNNSEPVLFHSSGFQIIDPTEPSFWISEVGEDSSHRSRPANWSGSFFEEFHDNVDDRQLEFWNDLRRLYPWTAKRQSRGSTSNGKTGS